MPDFLPPSRKEVIRRRSNQFAEVTRLIALGAPAAPNSNARLVYSGAIAHGDIPKTRAGVPASPLGTEADPVLAAYGSVAVAWLQSLRSISAFDAMLPDMKNVPMLTKVAITTTGFVASEQDQGVGIPVQAAVFAAPGALAPRRCTVIAASTEELLRTSDGQAIFDDELKAAVVASIDKAFITDLIAENAPIASSGALADIVALLAAVDLRATSAPYFIMSPTRRKKAAGLVSTSGFPIFPDLRIVDTVEETAEDESEILSVPVLASDSIADDKIVLADAAGIFASGNTPVEVVQSRIADVAMATDASSMASTSGSPPEPTATQVVSMFQTNGRAIRCTRYFSYRIGRSNAVASISGISW